MTELDLEFPELAAELIQEFGAELSYNIAGQGVYDPATSRATTPSLHIPIKAIVEDYDLQGSGQGFSSGLIEAGDKKLTIAALSFTGFGEPTSGDRFDLNGAQYGVLNVKRIYSGQLVCLFVVQARK